MEPISKHLSESQLNKLKAFKHETGGDEYNNYLSFDSMYNTDIIKHDKQQSVKARKRKEGGGRKGNSVDLSDLYHIDVDSLHFDDIITGCIRSYDNEKATTHKGHKFKPETIKTIFKVCGVVTTKSIMELTGLKERQARNYVGVVRLISLFLHREQSTNIVDYIDIDSLDRYYR